MKLPIELKVFQGKFNVNYLDLLSVNPKTKKSEVETRILHLLPHDLSGHNVCANAGNCRRICLHFSGNPGYFTNKKSARMKRTLAYFGDKQGFMVCLLIAICNEFHKGNREQMAIRLNGTSDIKWESVDFNVSDEVAEYINKRFGLIVNTGNVQNIFHALAHYVMADNLKFYDYTKNPRNWELAKHWKYYLTFSFDGWGNRNNIENCKQALANGINVAAAFNLKRGDLLPERIVATPLGGDLKVYDGDLSDYRPNDPPGGQIIGLRFKLPRSTQYDANDTAKFCLA
jgi:hypothetical protein